MPTASAATLAEALAGTFERSAALGQERTCVPGRLSAWASSAFGMRGALVWITAHLPAVGNRIRPGGQERCVTVAFGNCRPYAAAAMLLRILEPRDPDYATRLRSLADRSAEIPPSI